MPGEARHGGSLLVEVVFQDVEVCTGAALTKALDVGEKLLLSRLRLIIPVRNENDSARVEALVPHFVAAIPARDPKTTISVKRLG